ncbi:MAG TPA: YceK/YidQ family lipoprotein [Pseudomonas xinjiangensis]|uniref:YceK/YidQ family lipoprotein n=2 Tax=root TaxID=1 RepID=A0A7V1BNX1_9GAMM|nr:YceK/YidQ family lipoprotein [Halopseudomonas xinjiangensis]HEC47459.1 YceK/YidQ family lipoprotein [Halopseudomonas xinjiangensis]
MKATLRIGLILSVILSLTACGTILGRLNEPLVEGEYYKSTKTDLLMIGVPISDAKQDAIAVAMVCWYMIVCPFITVASLPLDVAVDTLLLPFDATLAND